MPTKNASRDYALERVVDALIVSGAYFAEGQLDVSKLIFDGRRVVSCMKTPAAMQEVEKGNNEHGTK